MKRFRISIAVTLLVLFASTLLIFPWGCQRAPEQEEPQDFGTFHSVTSPSWVPGTIVYEVFVRAFSPEGTFQKVTERLPELKELGVETVWLMPIYPIGTVGRKGTLGSPYAVRDYRAINPEFGRGTDLRQLVITAHELGMKVILDWVANHSANDHIEMGRHPDWFVRDRKGNFTREVDDWWDVTDFDYHNREMRSYMHNALQYWIRDFNIDGYRCDVAGMVPGDFWVDVRAQLRKMKPTFFLLAEWEDPKMHINQFDATYDWSLYHTLKEIRRGEAKAEEAIDLVLKKEREFPKGALRLRFLENHDEQRAAKVFGVPGFEPYATFVFTLRGLPMLYAGQEVADTVKPALFDKVEVHWGDADYAVRRFYKQLIRLRKDHTVFVHGETMKIPTDRPSEIVAYARMTGDRTAVVALNFSDREMTATLQFPEELRSGRDGEKFIRGKEKPVQLLSKPTHQIALKPYESMVFLSE
ncbi:MAG: DUF3459 domain-containing protein [Gemmatimonadota bacterium]|nr:MAG: DUF3459 domain-containing protein [Gemmatimonadota bacterium]